MTVASVGKCLETQLQRYGCAARFIWGLYRGLYGPATKSDMSKTTDLAKPFEVDVTSKLLLNFGFQRAPRVPKEIYLRLFDVDV